MNKKKALAPNDELGLISRKIKNIKWIYNINIGLLWTTMYVAHSEFGIKVNWIFEPLRNVPL